tara:strand:+ start:4045 stop:6009 length:1965 start_codon:yes stop_codon:yes gene_type:complete
MGNPRLQVDIIANLKQFQKSLDQVAPKLQALGKRLSALGTTATKGLTLPLTLAGGAAIKAAMDSEESLNKVRVAFGSSSDSVEEFASTTLKSFGISSGSAMEAAALFGDMATSMGLTRSASAEMSTSLVGLAGDLASFKNIQIDVAQTALSGIFTGETESLKKLGIVMTQTNLQQFALSQGITKNIKDMTEAEKTNLRFSFVMAKTANAQGDFARTGGGAANQTRIFRESLSEIAGTLGSLILPIFTKIITKLNDLAQRFLALQDRTKSLVIFFGALVAAIGPTILILGKLAQGAGALAGALGKLTKAQALLIAKVALVTAAIAGIALTFIFVKKNAESFGAFFENLFNGIKRFVFDAVSSISAKLAAFLEKVGFEGLSEDLNQVSKNFQQFSEDIPEAKDTNFQSFSEFFQELKKDSKEVMDSVLGAVGLSTGAEVPVKPVVASDEPIDQLLEEDFADLDLTIEVDADTDPAHDKIMNDFMVLQNELQSLNNFMAGQFTQGITGTAEALGELFSGEVSPEDFGKRILTMLANFASDFGKLIISMAITAEVFKKSILGNPGAAIAAGATLIALASAIKSKAASFGEGMRDGGIVPPGFNNDTFPALLSSGETVVPKSRSLPGDLSSNLNLNGEFRIKGSDLVLSLAEANYEIDR